LSTFREGVRGHLSGRRGRISLRVGTPHTSWASASARKTARRHSVYSKHGGLARDKVRKGDKTGKRGVIMYEGALQGWGTRRLSRRIGVSLPRSATGLNSNRRVCGDHLPLWSRKHPLQTVLLMMGAEKNKSLMAGRRQTSKDGWKGGTRLLKFTRRNTSIRGDSSSTLKGDKRVF